MHSTYPVTLATEKGLKPLTLLVKHHLGVNNPYNLH